MSNSRKKAASATAAEAVSQPVVGQDGSFEAILAQPARVAGTRAAPKDAVHGVVIGVLTGVAADGTPLVEYPGAAANGPMQAVSTERVEADDVGRELALSFVGGDPARPLILGFLIRPGATEQASRADPVDVNVDGETVTLTGKQQIVLKCGKASITLTRAGKVIIKGAYLSSRSTGVNRIKGGSVQIN